MRLSAFELERGDVELLWQRMLALFDAGSAIRSKISLTLPSERLTFDSIEELTGYQSLRGRVTKFSLEMRQGLRVVAISSGGPFATAPTLKVEGESDIWCAGAIEAVVHVIQQRRVWHFWLIHFPFTLVFIALACMPWVKLGPFQGFPAIPISLLLAWLAMTALFGYFSFYKARVLPVASITFTRELGFFRRYAGELGLILGLLSLALAIYMWAVPYGA